MEEEERYDAELEIENKSKMFANNLERIVNSFGDKHHKVVAELVTRFHRTVQQCTMRMLLTIIEYIGSQQSYDARNEASVKLARDITELAKNRHLPFI